MTGDSTKELATLHAGYANKKASLRAAIEAQRQAAGVGSNKASNGPQAGYTRIQASDGSMHDIPKDKIDVARQRDPKLKVIQ